MTSARGNETGATPADFTTTYTRNAFGQATDIEDPLGRHTMLEYNANQQLTKLTDRDAKITQFAYDAAGQKTKTTRADGSELDTNYDQAGRIAAQIDGKDHATSLDYDAQGRLQTITDPLDRSQTFDYDAAGNLQTSTDAQKRTTTYGHDDADRLTAISYSSGTPDPVTITYNADDQPLTITDASGTSNSGYDSLGRLTTHTSAPGQTTGYGYDLADQVTSIDYPDALTLYDTQAQDPQQPVTTGTVTRGYDDDGNLTSVTDWLSHETTFDYDADGQLSAVARPNGTAASYQHDANGTQTEITELGLTTTLDRTPTALLSSATPAAGAAATFSYDDVERLTAAGSATYGYDDADNLTQTTLDGQAVTQTFDAANELQSTSHGAQTTATFDYDADGNRTTRTSSGAGDIDYSYDQAGHLTGYDGPNQSAAGTITESYTYDAAGLRQTKTSGTQRRNYAYDLSGTLPTIITDGPTAYITGPDSLPIEQITQNGNVRYYHHDQLGSTTALTDSTGSAIATYSYDPYGNPTGSPPTIENPFGYAGQYADTASGLQYLRARYYDPTTGQFLTRDPVEVETRQPYAYANNNPTNYTDPTGLIFGIPGTPSIADIGMSVSNAAAGALESASFGYSTKLAGATLGFDAECVEWGPGGGTGAALGILIGPGKFRTVAKGAANLAAKGEGALSRRLGARFAEETGSYDPGEFVRAVMRRKKGSIQRAPLPPGSPSWDEVREMTMAEIEAAAKENQPGYKTILKLLQDKRFDR